MGFGLIYFWPLIHCARGTPWTRWWGVGQFPQLALGPDEQRAPPRGTGLVGRVLIGRPDQCPLWPNLRTQVGHSRGPSRATNGQCDQTIKGIDEVIG